MHGADAGHELLLCYGGTFDPIHLGHLAIACAARDALGVPVFFVPSADPPHRPPPGADAKQRARMIALAIAHVPGLRLDLRELQRATHSDAPSYTYDTLQELRRELGPQQPIAWLMGADSFIALPQWHRWQDLAELAHLVVAERPGSGLEAALPPALAAWSEGRWVRDASALSQRPAGGLWRLRQPLREESASAVRAQIAAGGQWQKLLPAPVADYIVTHRLYGIDAG